MCDYRDGQIARGVVHKTCLPIVNGIPQAEISRDAYLSVGSGRTFPIIRRRGHKAYSPDSISAGCASRTLACPAQRGELYSKHFWFYCPRRSGAPLDWDWPYACSLRFARNGRLLDLNPYEARRGGAPVTYTSTQIQCLCCVRAAAACKPHIM